jgi:biotin transport system substrate-specific component
LFLGGVALGLPLLSGGRGGIGVFLTPSAGFLLGYTFGAACAGAAMRWLPGPVLPRAFVASALGGIGVVYLFGIPVLAMKAHLTLWQAGVGSLVFIPGDLTKCVLAALIVRTVVRGLPEWELHRG